MRRLATAARPIEVDRAAMAIFVIAAIHVLALALVATHRDAIAAAVASAHPGWPGARIDREAFSRFLQSLVPHAILPVVLVVRGRRLLAGGRRARLVITILLGVQLAAHATLPLQLERFPGYGPWLIAVQAVSLAFEGAALWLLWRPRPARAYFAGPRKVATT
jgi:hypothetical protein